MWIVALLLAFIAGMLWSSGTPGASSTAFAQLPPMAGARGVYAFAAQIDRNRQGLFMLDIEQGTLWCYALESDNAVTKLRLIAGRSWIYDRYLKDFNCLAPSVAEIQQLVARQRETTGATIAPLPAARVMEDDPDRRDDP